MIELKPITEENLLEAFRLAPAMAIPRIWTGENSKEAHP